MKEIKIRNKNLKFFQYTGIEKLYRENHGIIENYTKKTGNPMRQCSINMMTWVKLPN